MAEWPLGRKAANKMLVYFTSWQCGRLAATPENPIYSLVKIRVVHPIEQPLLKNVKFILRPPCHAQSGEEFYLRLRSDDV